MLKNVVAIDDHTLFLDGLRSLVTRYHDWHWEAGFCNGNEFLREIENLSIDLLLLDISLPSLDGFQILEILRDRDYQFPVVFLTGLKHPLLIARVQDSGAKGCLLKEDSVEDLHRTLNAIRDGVTFHLSHSLQEIANPKTRNLSPREFEILGLIAEGYINKEIAGMLKISEETVITHRKRIKDKTGAYNAADLATLAVEIGLYNH